MVGMNGYQKISAVLGFLLLLLTVGAVIRQSHQPEIVEIIPTLTGRPELCLTCHQGIEEISASHPQEAFGCVLCHGGDGLALNADLAHATMRGGSVPGTTGNPSDLAVVKESCGGSACHSGVAEDGSDHIHRVLTSVQATYAGAIAQVNYAFGQQPDPAARWGVFAVQDDNITTETGVPYLEKFSPGPDAPEAIHAFSQDCQLCHITAVPLDQPYFFRATGCAMRRRVHPWPSLCWAPPRAFGRATRPPLRDCIPPLVRLRGGLPLHTGFRPSARPGMPRKVPRQAQTGSRLFRLLSAR